MRKSDELNLARLYREIKDTDPKVRERKRRLARRMVQEVCAVELAHLSEVPRQAGAEWYNYRYRYSVHKAEYDRKPSESVYIAIWRTVLRWINEGESVADFGCGVGQFAQLAIESGVKYVLGVDFSKVAIKMAGESNPGHADCFQVADLHDKTTYKLAEFDVAVLLETLEHVENDLWILRQIPLGKQVILSVPDFRSYGHCRFFKTLKEAVSRYQPFLKVLRKRRFTLSNNTKIWLISGVRNENSAS